MREHHLAVFLARREMHEIAQLQHQSASVSYHNRHVVEYFGGHVTTEVGRLVNIIVILGWDQSEEAHTESEIRLGPVQPLFGCAVINVEDEDGADVGARAFDVAKGSFIGKVVAEDRLDHHGREAGKGIVKGDAVVWRSCVAMLQILVGAAHSGHVGSAMLQRGMCAEDATELGADGISCVDREAVVNG